MIHTIDPMDSTNPPPITTQGLRLIRRSAVPFPCKNLAVPAVIASPRPVHLNVSLRLEVERERSVWILPEYPSKKTTSDLRSKIPRIDLSQIREVYSLATLECSESTPCLSVQRIVQPDNSDSGYSHPDGYTSPINLWVRTSIRGRYRSRRAGILWDCR